MLFFPKKEQICVSGGRSSPAGSIEERLPHSGARSHLHRRWRDRTAGWKCWAHPAPGSRAHRPLLSIQNQPRASISSAEAREGAGAAAVPPTPADPAAGRPHLLAAASR
jgi:hypothetical protein